MTRLLASDLDGTLLQTGGTISEENVHALARASASGLGIIFVTGRPPRWMHMIPEMTGQIGKALTSNGAMLIDMETREHIHAEFMAGDVGIEAARRLQSIDPGMAFAVELARHDDAFLIDSNYVPRWETTTPPSTATVDEMFNTELVVKLLARPSEEAKTHADEFLKQAEEALAGIVDVTHSDINDLMIEMSTLGVNKGSGLAKYAASLGLEAEHVAAVGDMPNDIPMIKWAGRGAAVGNAHDWVKAVADEVLPTNDEHAVSIFIDRILAN